MIDLGKILVLVGGLAIAAGLLLMLAGRAHLPLGRLPGDLVYRGKHTTFYFPLVTCLVVSAVMSAILYFVARFKR